MKSILAYNPNTRSLVDWGFDTFLDSFDRVFDDPVFSMNGKLPRVDVREEEGKYILEADVPGLTEKDIDVKVDGNLLTISSAKKEETENKKDGYLIKERKSYSFSRSFTLPDDVARDKIEAHFKNGLLSLTMEKNPESKPKSIEIKSN
jgi:HSP20 family protein